MLERLLLWCYMSDGACSDQATPLRHTNQHGNGTVHIIDHQFALTSCKIQIIQLQQAFQLQIIYLQSHYKCAVHNKIFPYKNVIYNRYHFIKSSFIYNRIINLLTEMGCLDCNHVTGMFLYSTYFWTIIEVGLLQSQYRYTQGSWANIDS